MRYYTLLLLLFIKVIFLANLTQTKAEFFVGIGYINLGDRYTYTKLNATQYIGTAESGIFSFPVNDYIDVEFNKTSSFGMRSALSGSGIALSIGNKFKFNNIFYTVEIFGNYSGGKVKDTTMIPEQGFNVSSITMVESITKTFGTNSTVGINSNDILGFIGQQPGTFLGSIIEGFICGKNQKPCTSQFPIQPEMIAPIIENAICPNGAPCTISIKTPEQNIPIIYSMPVNIGMQNRLGYDFNKNFSLNLITGGAMTIFNITQGENKETVYKGRFIAGLGAEFNITEGGNLKLYADYKYYIPLQKDIEREYPDSKNPGKTTKVKITNFGAETQAFELGIKYYF